jgi:hypothetical protein
MHLAASAKVLSASLALAASIWIGITNAQTAATPPVAHFHHVHINATDPDASVAFYTSRFDCEKAIGPDGQPAVRMQTSWILFNRVTSQGDAQHTERAESRIEEVTNEARTQCSNSVRGLRQAQVLSRL